jgi:RhtB (resistance to homoserine/threonine) family protein
MGIHDLLLFVTAGFLLNLSPGPDTLYITQRTVTGGWRAGVVACWGIAAGLALHAVAAAAGLSALIAASAPAFIVVRTLGAAYLIYLGWQMWRGASHATPDASAAAAPVQALPLRRVFAQAFLTNVLNPKVILFFLSFVPQFVDPGTPQRHWAYLLLGAVFVTTSMLWCHALVALVHLARGRWKAPGRLLVHFDRGLGVLLMGLGARLFFVSRP